MSVVQDRVSFSGLPEELQGELKEMKAYAFKTGSVLELEQNILKKFSAYEGTKEDFLPTGQRVAMAAGWVIVKDGEIRVPMFSRNAEMYIGQTYQDTTDVAVKMEDVDVLTASRVILPNGGYTPGGKVSTFREDKNFMDLAVSYVSDATELAFEFNHELQEACYMPVGIMTFDEPDDWFIDVLQADSNVFFMSVNDIEENKRAMPLTAKAEIFLCMVKQYIKEID